MDVPAALAHDASLGEGDAQLVTIEPLKPDE
jgi:hypothetical protein